MSIALNFNGTPNRAVIWLSDGTRFADVSAVADALEIAGMTDILLSVEPEGDQPNPMHVSGDQHVGIRLDSNRAELFLTDAVPFQFTRTLSKELKAIDGIHNVLLRSAKSKHDPKQPASKADPFDGQADNKGAASSDPF